MNALTGTKSCACKTAGQITAYAAVLLGAQYRTHAFSILIFKDYTRLLRWDRSGVVVTAPVYYNSESYLFDFLIRYDNASKETCGHDLTVRPASKVGGQTALMFLGPDPVASHYIVSSPRARLAIPEGR